MAKKTFKIKFYNEHKKDEIKDTIGYRLDVVEEKKKSLIIKAKSKSKVKNVVKECISEYNTGIYWSDMQGGYIEKEDYNIKEMD